MPGLVQSVVFGPGMTYETPTLELSASDCASSESLSCEGAGSAGSASKPASFFLHDRGVRVAGAAGDVRSNFF
jgi:hypothetical protein